MRNTLTILCLFLTACATSQDTPPTYERGTYRPAPRAPTFEPNHEAPHTFRSGQPAPALEPAPRPAPVPHTPQTQREDTIWASGSPTASVSPRLLDVLLPMPESNDVDDMRPTMACATSMDAAARRVMQASEISKMQDTFRKCLAALLGHECTNSMVIAFDGARRAGEHFDAVETGRWKAANETARDFNRRVCTPDLPLRAIEAVAGPIVQEWRRYMSVKKE